MYTYHSAMEFLTRAKNPDKGRPIRNNTRLVRTEDGFGIKYHDTIIVEILRNGNYRLNNGGFQTVTTKSRINDYAPVHIRQKNWTWYVDGGQRYFHDMEITPGGDVVNTDPNPDHLEYNKAKRAEIRLYASAYVRRSTWPAPGGGDCWSCLGVIDSHDHLQSHLDEKYYVPALALNALAESGYPSPALIYNMQCKSQTKRAIVAYLDKRLLK